MRQIACYPVMLSLFCGQIPDIILDSRLRDRIRCNFKDWLSQSQSSSDFASNLLGSIDVNPGRA
jgi:hypothetical protein